MDPTYPITITREALRAKKACEQGLAAFDKVAPSGVLVAEDVFAHMGLLAGTLAPFEAWAQGKALLPPIRYAGGHGSTVSGGYRSTVSGGDYSHVSGGAYSRVSGGYRSTVSGGDGSRVSGGRRSHVSGGHGSTVSGGYGSHVSGGAYSRVSGGDYSHVSGGYGSRVSGGYRSHVSGGDGSHVSGGDGSTLHLRYWDGARDRTAVAYVGEDGIEPDTFYKYEHPKGWVKTFPDSNT